MDYKEKYEKALAMAKDIHDDNPSSSTAITVCEQIFPELAESKDERIRQFLIHEVTETSDEIMSYRNINKKDVLAWLEKQGEQKKSYDTCNSSMMDNKKSPYGEKRDFGYFEKKSADKVEPKFKKGDVIRRKDGDGLEWTVEEVHKDGYYNIVNSDRDDFIYLDDNWELVEHKLDDKVEPKFRVNDFIVNNNSGGVNQVTKIRDDEYCIWPLYSEEEAYLTFIYIDNDYHLWTIQDAKDGDVLYECNEKKPFIFKELETKHIGDIASYCDIFNGIFNPNEDNWTTLDIVPATKEQRDLLFSKMKEAGYEWNSEHKQLEKIEQKIAWSKVDERMITRIVESLSAYADKLQYEGFCHNSEVLYEQIDWLKSLRPQSTWKPNDEQLKSLQEVIYQGHFTSYPNSLETLYEQLKKLRVEQL